MFGRTPSEPLDMWLKQQQPPKNPTTEVILAKPAMVARLNTAFGQVQARLRAAHDHQKGHHDKKSRDRAFEVGDEVMLLDERVVGGQTKKLHPPWRPGYRVVAKIGPLNYHIEHPTGEVKCYGFISID